MHAGRWREPVGVPYQPLCPMSEKRHCEKAFHSLCFNFLQVLLVPREVKTAGILGKAEGLVPEA